MPIAPNQWYESAAEVTTFNQGDILDGIPTVTMSPASDRWILLRPTPPVTVVDALAGNIPKTFRPHVEQAAPDRWVGGQELVLAKGLKRRVMLVNHGCDIDNRKYYQVAPVYAAADLGEARITACQRDRICLLPAARSASDTRRAVRRPQPACSNPQILFP